MRWGVFVERAELALDSLHCKNNAQNYLAQKGHIQPARCALYHRHHGYYLYQTEVPLPDRLQKNQLRNYQHRAELQTQKSRLIQRL